MKLNWKEMTARERDVAVGEHVIEWPVNPMIPLMDCPSFTTSWDFAALVVEKMREKGFTVDVNSDRRGHWKAIFYNRSMDFFRAGDAESLPEAISLSALRASGIEVEV